MSEPAALVAAVAATLAVVVHGGVGHRWMRQQLDAVQLPRSELFGDADVGVRVFTVTWHAVTALFAVSAGALYLVAFGAVSSPELLRFVSALHAALLLVGLLVFLRRLDAVLRPVPPVFVTCMTTVVVASWLAAR